VAPKVRRSETELKKVLKKVLTCFPMNVFDQFSMQKGFEENKRSFD
jgi:hypothetical protein